MTTYHKKNSYIVSELPTPMWDDINVQPCLTCGTFANSIVEIDLWMSGGGSKSLLHKVNKLDEQCHHFHIFLWRTRKKAHNRIVVNDRILPKILAVKLSFFTLYRTFNMQKKYSIAYLNSINPIKSLFQANIEYLYTQ